MFTVLVISGSPRKGDGYKVVREMEVQMQESGEVQFDYLFLKDMNLEYCKGCLTCMRKGEEACPLNDAVAIRDRLLQADGVIFASPVYVHTISALMKNFFDRLAYFCHRPQFHGKPALLIATTEISGLPETLKSLEFPVKAWGFTIVQRLGIYSAAFKAEGPYRSRMLETISQTAAIFYRAMQDRQLPRPGIKELLFFNALGLKVSLHKDKFPFDEDYWNQHGWHQARYFYPTSINPLLEFIAKLAVRQKEKGLRRLLDNHF